MRLKSSWPKRWDYFKSAIYYRPRDSERHLFDGKYYFYLGKTEVEAYERWGTVQHLRSNRAIAADSQPLGASTMDWVKGPFQQAKSNAKKRGIPFTLKLREARALAEESQGRCQLTHMKFDFTHKHSVKNRRPYVPSLDRIDSEDSYHAGNVRIVLAAINISIGSWGEATYRRIAEAYLVAQIARRPRNMLSTAQIDELREMVSD